MTGLVARLGALTTLILVLAGAPTPSRAQCANAVTPSCEVYESCFAKYCPCAAGPTEYFRSYGLKYCKAFLGNASLSAAGKKWRDSTLVCLQESIVPKLDISTHPSCNCAAMKSYAYASHVACYTKAGMSICELPLSDVASISATVDLKDMFDAPGWKQMSDVSSICAQNAPDDGRRTLWKKLETVLKARTAGVPPVPPAPSSLSKP